MPNNHQSLQAEHGIKSLSDILTTHLTSLGHMWPKYLLLTMFNYNLFHTSNLVKHNLYELIFGRKPGSLLSLDSLNQGLRSL